jgi:hypothetical protein
MPCIQGHCPLGIILVGALIPTAASGTQNPGRFQLSVSVYDYAGLEPETLADAEQEAARIFNHSGLEVIWLHRFPVKEQPGSRPGSAAAAPAGTPALRFVRKLSVAQSVRPDTMGWTAGRFVSVSVEKAEQMARLRGGTLAEVLGHAIAHELGHVLLPGTGHTASGIMKARWNLGDWDGLAHRWLVFTPEQSVALRRHAAALATELGSMSPEKGSLARASDTAIMSDFGQWHSQANK